MVIYEKLGTVCCCCNKKYPNQSKPKKGAEYICPRCRTIDTISSLLQEAQDRVDYDIELIDVKVIRDNLDIIDRWLNDVVYFIKEG